VSPTGQVTSAAVARSTLGSKPVEACIAAEVRRWTLPAPSGGVAATITYPFVFQ
jgi:TonB family protein